MKRIGMFLVFFCLSFASWAKVYTEVDIQKMYEAMGLRGQMSYQAFTQGFRGMAHIKKRKSNLLTIVDFTKPSTQERLFVLDMQRKKVILKTYVSHGKGSGNLYASSFSNVEGTFKSSNGFFLTGQTYFGKNGTSLRLHGLELGRNDQAFSRTLVIHASQYSNREFGQAQGRLGRSLGCYTIPSHIHRYLIRMLQNQQVFYVHSQGLYYANYKALLPKGETL